MNNLRSLLGSMFRKLSFYTPLRRFILFRYEFNMSPAALAALAGFVSETKDVDGMIVEIGCDRGHTTVFLNRHMDEERIEKPYLCIDTFAGFVDEDIRHEREQRGKSDGYSGFSTNSLRWFQVTMRLNGIRRVEAVAADVKTYTFAQDLRISFALVDVDIYLPSVDALQKVYERLSPGGIIAVDDCHHTAHRYDGAHYAYLEFLESHGMQPEYVARRLGVIRKA